MGEIGTESPRKTTAVGIGRMGVVWLALILTNGGTPVAARSVVKSAMVAPPGGAGSASRMVAVTVAPPVTVVASSESEINGSNVTVVLTVAPLSEATSVARRGVSTGVVGTENLTAVWWNGMTTAAGGRTQRSLLAIITVIPTAGGAGVSDILPQIGRA